VDISTIKADKVNTTDGIKIGNEDAPVKIIEFINLKCPYCKMWYEDSKDLLTEYVEGGKVQRIIKHFDKEKPSLKKGNIVHQYLDYSNPTKALEEIDYFFAHQDEWGSLEELSEIETYVEEKRQLKKQTNELEAQGIIKEANNANVVFVPTVFIEEQIFDEHITQHELKEMIDSRL
jgi:protein-disulfide isomerase